MGEERLAEEDRHPPEEQPREVHQTAQTALNLGAGASALGRRGEFGKVHIQRPRRIGPGGERRAGLYPPRGERLPENRKTRYAARPVLLQHPRSLGEQARDPDQVVEHSF